MPGADALFQRCGTGPRVVLISMGCCPRFHHPSAVHEPQGARMLTAGGKRSSISVRGQARSRTFAVGHVGEKPGGFRKQSSDQA